MIKKMLGILIILIIILSSIFILYEISKSRKFQFFGIIINKVNTTDKVVALTFDDGPEKFYTDKILDILSNYNIKATFYLIGNSIENNPEETLKIVKAGHDIGNHTYSHQRLVLKSWNFVKNEIDKTDKLIKQIGYNREITFRPPNCKKLLVLPYYLWKNNRKTITWNLEPDSIDKIRQNPGDMVKYIDENIKPGSIILMHVMNKNREASLDSIISIIQILKNKGYSFLTVTELIDKYSKRN